MEAKKTKQAEVEEAQKKIAEIMVKAQEEVRCSWHVPLAAQQLLCPGALQKQVWHRLARPAEKFHVAVTANAPRTILVIFLAV